MTPHELHKRAEDGVLNAIRDLPHADLGLRDSWGNGWLHRAAWRVDADAVAAWLARGLEPNARSHAGLTPLHYACSGSLIEEALLSHGPTDVLVYEEPARLKTVDLLIRAGADVDARDAAFRTPLMYASYGVRTEVLKELLAAGADPSLRDEEDQTAAQHSQDRYCLLGWTEGHRLDQEVIRDEGRRIVRLLQSG